MILISHFSRLINCELLYSIWNTKLYLLAHFITISKKYVFVKPTVKYYKIIQFVFLQYRKEPFKRRMWSVLCEFLPLTFSFVQSRRVLLCLPPRFLPTGLSCIIIFKRFVNIFILLRLTSDSYIFSFYLKGLFLCKRKGSQKGLF